MNIFCLLFGHTWIHVAEDPKTRWSCNKAGSLLDATPAGEPRFFEQCRRCGKRRDWAAGSHGKAREVGS